MAKKRSEPDINDSQDRPQEDLSPEEIARREAEKAELLRRFPAPADTAPAQALQPAPAVQVPTPAALPAALHGRSAAEIQALIDQERADHNAAMSAAEGSFEARLAALVQEQRDTEAREERAVRVDVREGLKAATDAALAGAKDTEATARERSAERDREEIRVRVDVVVKSARQALAEITTIMQSHRPEIERLAAITEQEWRRGLPSEGPAANSAFNLARTIPVRVGEVTGFVALVRQQVETGVRELERAVQDAPVPFGARNTDRFYEWRQWYNGALRDLDRVNGDAVAHFNSMIRTLLGYVSTVNEYREKYKNSPEAAAPFQTERRDTVIRNLEAAKQHESEGRVERMADTDLFRR